MNDVPDMVWKTDHNGQCIDVTEGWAAFVGRSRASQLGQGWVETIHPEDRERVMREQQREMAAGRRFFCVFRVMTASGAWATVRSAGRPMTRHGDADGYVGGVYPITARVGQRSAEPILAVLARRTPTLEPCEPVPRSMTDSL